MLNFFELSSCFSQTWSRVVLHNWRRSSFQNILHCQQFYCIKSKPNSARSLTRHAFMLYLRFDVQFIFCELYEVYRYRYKTLHRLWWKVCGLFQIVIIVIIIHSHSTAILHSVPLASSASFIHGNHKMNHLIISLPVLMLALPWWWANAFFSSNITSLTAGDYIWATSDTIPNPIPTCI